jgi:DNA repair protein SbcD/Mre11
MKIFHTADWHIGKLVNGFYMTEDQEFVMEQLYEKIEEEKPDVLIIAGDLYDRSVPPIQAIELLNKVLYKIVMELKTPVIALAGNHDSNERIDFGSELLTKSGLYIRGTVKRHIEKITLNDEYGPVNFYPIPYIDPPIARDLYEDKNIKTHDDAMRVILEHIKEDFNQNERNVAIAHGYVTYINSENEAAMDLEESESEKPLSIGGTALINAAYFEDFNYTALGHLHGPQKVGSDKIRYAGSLLKYSFSEARQKKGITIVNLDEKGEIHTDFYKFSPKRDFRVIKGQLKELIDYGACSSENNEDYIKAVLTDKGELLDPMAKLRSVYPNVMELAREEKVRDVSHTKTAASNIKEKSKLDLFQDFYEDIMGDKSSKNEIELMKKIIEKAERGGKENED